VLFPVLQFIRSAYVCLLRLCDDVVIASYKLLWIVNFDGLYRRLTAGPTSATSEQRDYTSVSSSSSSSSAADVPQTAADAAVVIQRLRREICIVHSGPLSQQCQRRSHDERLVWEINTRT